MSNAQDNPRPNWFRLSDGRYLVRTQAGFDRATAHFCELWNIDSEDRSSLAGFPKSYPSVCTYHYDSHRVYFRVSCYHVNKHRQFLEMLLKELEGQ